MSVLSRDFFDVEDLDYVIQNPKYASNLNSGRKGLTHDGRQLSHKQIKPFEDRLIVSHIKKTQRAPMIVSKNTLTEEII